MSWIELTILPRQVIVPVIPDEVTYQQQAILHSRHIFFYLNVVYILLPLELIVSE